MENIVKLTHKQQSEFATKSTHTYTHRQIESISLESIIQEPKTLFKKRKK